jgi:hypothetical protein
MQIKKPVTFPPPVLNTLFWARWAGTPSDESLIESTLLVSPTSSKYLALEYLMPKSANVYHMTRESQVSELIGSTILSDPTKIQNDTDHLRHAVRDDLTERQLFDLDETKSRPMAIVGDRCSAKERLNCSSVRKRSFNPCLTHRIWLELSWKIERCETESQIEIC